MPSRPFVAIPELDEDPTPLAAGMQLSVELPAAKQPPSEASRSLAHTLTRSLLRVSASSLHGGDGAQPSPPVDASASPGDFGSHKASGMTTPRVSHVMLNGAEPDVLVRLDCDTSQSSTDVDGGPDDACMPSAVSPSLKRAPSKQSAVAFLLWPIPRVSFVLWANPARSYMLPPPWFLCHSMVQLWCFVGMLVGPVCNRRAGSEIS